MLFGSGLPDLLPKNREPVPAFDQDVQSSAGTYRLCGDSSDDRCLKER